MMIEGIIPPVATPLRNETQIDEQGLERLIPHLLNGGVHGLFLLGTTGEGTSLSYDLRAKLVRLACSLVDKQVPVLVSITDTSFEDSVRMAHTYADAGADFLVVAPPYYNPLSQKEVCKYFYDLAYRIPLPFLLYNIPSHTKINLTPSTVRIASEVGAKGIKDSSGNLTHMLSILELLKDSPDFTILSGSEMLIAETVLGGGHGAVPGGANLFPGLYVDYYRAIKNNDQPKMKFCSEIIRSLNNTLYHFGPYPSGIIMGIKSALEVLGICNGFTAHPINGFDGKTYRHLKAYVLEMNYKIEHSMD